MLTLQNLFERAGLINSQRALYDRLIQEKSHIYNPIRLKKIEESFVLLEEQGLTASSFRPLYLALIETSNNPLKVAKSFLFLNKNKIHYQDHQVLYESLARNIFNIKKLSKGFVLLKEAGFSYLEHPELYHVLIPETFSPDDLARAFALLKQHQLTYEEHKPLYEMIIKINSLYAKRMAKIFVLLDRNDINYQNHLYLYQVLEQNEVHAKNLARDFISLTKGNLSYPQYKELYEKIILNKRYNNNLAKAFVFLTKENFTYPEYQDFYNAFEANFTNTNDDFKKIKRDFLFLDSLNSFKKENVNIYLTLIKNHQVDIVKSITLLKDIGIDYSEKNKAFFSEKILFTNSELLIYALEAFKNSGFNLQNHSTIVTKIISYLDEDVPSQTKLIKMIQNLTKYADTQKLLYPNEPGYQKQIEKLESLIVQDIIFTEGPLNKSAATIEIERLLKKIISTDISKVQIHYNELGHYILNLPNESQINLSILLKNSNLTQLDLNQYTFDIEGKITNIDNKLVKDLDALINSLIPNYWNISLNDNSYVGELPAHYQKAINIYTDGYYLNINRFFRGEAIKKRGTKLFDKDNIENNYLIYFLTGCLLNNLINKLPQKLSKSLTNKKWKDSIISDKALYRDEVLDETQIKSRLSNPWFFPALTSFTANKKGFDFFKQTKSKKLFPIQTKLENPPLSVIIDLYNEEEVIISPGTKVITIQGQKELISKIVNSPLLEIVDRRWSDEALVYALTHHLSKRYQDIDDTLIMNGKEIPRPNHNVTNAYRVMNYIDLLINYFREYANDPDFQSYCAEISDEDKEWLRVAAAFRVTGRESEVSALEDIDSYKKYRLNSAMYFKEFVEATKEKNLENIPDRTEKIFEVIVNMGNPDYEKDKEGQSLINEYRILSIAHNLDLPRCRNSREFLDSMAQCLNLSINSQSQQEAFTALLRYSIELIKKHGSCLMCDILPNDKLIDTDVDYQPIFYQSSTSLEALYKLTESVTRPTFTTDLNLPLSHSFRKK